MKFVPTNKIGGWFYIVDENNDKVGFRGKDGVLRVKRFKTLDKAVKFATRLQWVSEKEGE